MRKKYPQCKKGRGSTSALKFRHKQCLCYDCKQLEILEKESKKLNKNEIF